MLGIRESNAIEHLRRMAVYFDGDLLEGYGSAILNLDNEKGKGYISSYNIIPGLSVRVFNITFKEDFKIHMESFDDKPISFFYNLKGHLYHQFVGIENDYEKIDEHRNLIIVNDPEVDTNTIFPGGIEIKLSAIFVNKKEIVRTKSNSVRQLERNLKEILSKLDRVGPYRYLGKIDPRTAEYARIIAKNQRSDVMGRLATEGAVMNMLFSQIRAYYNDSIENQSAKGHNLNSKELAKCTEVGEYVQQNIHRRITIAEISQYLELTPKKLQAGIQYLYGHTLNIYMSHVRLSYAKDLLQTSSDSIAEICKKCGFSSPSYFSKTFLERYDLLPKDYRKAFQNENALFEICYRSKATDEVNKNVVQDIAKQAMKSNKKNNITGCLIYHERTFFQIIEGKKQDILRLYKNICEDERHYDIHLIWKGAKFVRNFGHWSMSLITDNGDLRVTYEDKLDNIDLTNLISDLKSSNEVSDALWRKIRNVIKSSSKALTVP